MDDDSYSFGEDEDYILELVNEVTSREFPNLKSGCYEVSIEHDDDCAIFSGMNCNCKADMYLIIRAEPEEYEEYDEGQQGLC